MDSWTTIEEDTIATKTPTKNTKPPTHTDLLMEGYVDDTPPQMNTIYINVIKTLFDAPQSGFLKLNPGGRKPNTVQSGLQSAAKRLNVKIVTRSREDDDGEVKVYVKLKGEG